MLSGVLGENIELVVAFPFVNSVLTVVSGPHLFWEYVSVTKCYIFQKLQINLPCFQKFNHVSQVMNSVDNK